MLESLTFEQFCAHYNNEEACIRELYSSRWPNGFRCPRCDYSHAYTIRTRRLPLYECVACHFQTSLTAGTIFEGSRTPLRLWFQSIFLHAQPAGISASRLTSIIGTTYKTAWLICHKIRHAMTEADNRERLTGLVRINWAQYGSPYNPTVYLHPQEHILLIGASLNDQDEISHVKIKQVPEDLLHSCSVSRYGEIAFINSHVDPNATEVISNLKKFRSHRLLPLRLLSTKVNRWINDTFRGIGAKHLQAYLNQCAYQINASIRKLPAFTNLFQLCITTPTLTYPHLIREKNTRRMCTAWFTYRAKIAG